MAWRSWRRVYLIGLLVSDAAAGVLAVGVCYLLRPGAVADGVQVLGRFVAYRVLGVVALLLWLGALALSGAYNERYPAAGIRDYRLPVITALRLMAVVAIGSYVLKAPVSRLLFIVYFPTLLAGALLARWSVRQVLTGLRHQGRALNRLVLAGDLAAVERFAEHLMRDLTHGYRVVGACVRGPLAADGTQQRTKRGGLPVFGAPDDVVQAASALSADSVALVGNPGFAETTLQQVAWQLERHDVDLLVAPDVVEVAGPRIRFTPVTGMPLLHITEPRISGVARFVKPIYERAFALLLLLAAAPLLAGISLAILIDSGGPVLFRQERVGRSGRSFEMLKFRTMVPGADGMLGDLLAENEHDGALFKIRHDPRITRIGRFLRKHSLDELPQLLNVLSGKMVLVGPRPCLPRELERFGEAARRRFLAYPGLTGLWQVSGRSDIPWEEAVRLDLYYVENWSPMLDLMICYRTLRVVLQGRGGY